jgi:hypothetical protein
MSRITYFHHSCAQCSKPFAVPATNESSSRRKKSKNRFCSTECVNSFRKEKQSYAQEVKCSNCPNLVTRTKPFFNNSKTGRFFCSKSCAASYNNLHKTHGNRRSKLEVFIESKLKTSHPNLKIDFNKKDTINSELDIYIPSLKLAFELNGIYHYEPIHGNDKLTSVQNNDKRKFQACLERSIELCIIDASAFTYFKEEKAQKYLDIILSVISSKLGISQPL